MIACGAPAPIVDASVDDATSDAATCRGAGTTSERTATGVSYALHVPATHRCEVASPLVVELLGAYDDGETSVLAALSESEGFVLVRPDASSVADVEAVIAALPVSIDAAAVYVIGSGAGAGLAARVLREGTLVPHGIGLVDYVASGEATPLRTLDPRPRVWLSTGERSLGIDDQNALRDALALAGHDVFTVRVRERDTGAATPAWLYPELWAWLERAQWPENGPAAQPWVRAMFPAPDASLLCVDARPDGTLVAGSADGRVFGTNESGKWSLLATLGEGALVGVVAGAGGVSMASTRGLVRSADGLSFTRDPSPTAVPLVALADDAGALYGVLADGTIAISRDGDRTWSTLGQLDRAEAVAVSPVTHTVIAVGQGGAYARLAPELTTHAVGARLHDVAAGPDGSWWIVGDAGTVLRSTDDGLTFDPVVDPDARALDDLYAVAIGDDGAMIAGGARGTVLVSHDGATLTLWATGGEGQLAAVRWVAPGRAMILGQQGYVALGDGL